jgi:hypothetical protein
MPLILAVEPDKRQAAQLAAVVRERLRADLVIADTAEHALAALADRVPDLILTSALLSTRDETALADHLRSLDAAAAHVQTLTVPVLGGATPRPSVGRGMLSALLRDRGQAGAAPDGCDPAVFAEQCAAYLERAEQERTAVQDAAKPERVERHAEPEPLHEFVPTPAPAALAVAHAPAHVTSVLRPVVPVHPSPTLVHPSAPPPQPLSLGGPEREFAAEIDLSPLLDEAVVEQLSAAIEAVSASTRPAPASTVPPLPEPPAAPVAPPKNPARAPKTRKQRVRHPESPEPDPFDPERCGFAALLAKLDEITRLQSPSADPDGHAGSPGLSH